MVDRSVEHCVADPLACRENGIGRDVWHEEQELLTAVAVGAFTGADHEVDARGNVPQCLVPSDVPVVVVVLSGCLRRLVVRGGTRLFGRSRDA